MSLSAIGLRNYRVNGPQETRALQVLSTRWSEIRKKKLSPPPSTSLFPQVIPSSKNPNIIRYTRHPDGVSEQNFFSPLPKKERSFLPSFVSESPASNTCLSVVSFLLSNCSSFRSHLLKKKSFRSLFFTGVFLSQKRQHRKLSKKATSAKFVCASLDTKKDRHYFVYNTCSQVSYENNQKSTKEPIFSRKITLVP